MENNNLNNLADILEYKVTSRTSNNSGAAKIFRDTQCVYNDFRTVKILNSTFNYLIQKFKAEEGSIKLTNTSKNIGDIALNVLDARESYSNDAKSIMVGDFILDVLIDNRYLQLLREPFFRVEEVYAYGNKKKINYNPYRLEMDNQFPKISIKPKERIGISLKKYKKWIKGKRITHGTEEILIKSNIKIDKSYDDKSFMKSINMLENVKWKINPQVAEVSYKLKNKLIATNIELTDEKENKILFNTIDIKRKEDNAHLKNIKLYRNNDLFEPHLGNSSSVPKLEKEIEKLTNRIEKLKNEQKIEEASKKLEKIRKIYDLENRRWTDKQYCLRIQSQAARNKAILETIRGNEDEPGWLGYEFYQSMYLDYRGRIYNRDPYFSYQSNDLARAHFLFAEEKEVDQKGAEYTFIHIASSFNQTYTIDELKDMEWLELDYVKELKSNSLVDISVDKMGVIDKHNWTIENIERILDVAEQPLEHLDYWMSAEKPWVFLSLCFEMGGIIGAALTGDTYYSSMPISIDGVNNGTQHLAAMSLDEKAGRLVGLTPMDIPKDFYLVMGKEILNLNKDTEIGNKLKQIPMKLIRKGISKRGSMTRAYDAGARKIGEIIFQDSYDAGITAKYNITRSDSRLLGKDLVNAYDSVCHGPVEIKKYLQALVKHKLEAMNLKDISWDTPSGFPVLTQKWVARKKTYQGQLQKKKISHVYLESTDKPALAEHLSAIGANWVHSYDASHMSLVINKLGYASFGAIHDSFSVHAVNVEELIYTTKSEFIKMYAKDIFQNMQAEIIWNDETFDEDVPELGELILEDIHESDFFFC
jgi:DNA-directed RNA polymerase